MGKSLGLDKKQMERHTFFHMGGYRIVNIYSTQRWYSGNQITVRVLWSCSGAAGCAS